MKVYNKEGQSMTVDKRQIEAVIEGGWSLTKPEPKPVAIKVPKAKLVRKPITKE